LKEDLRMDGKPQDRDASDLERPAEPHGGKSRTSGTPDRGATPGAEAVTGTPVPGSALSDEEVARLTDDIVAALKTVYDPEIPADIYELGLIYKVDVNDDREVAIEMTLTAPGCPVAGEMPKWVEDAVNAVPGIKGTSVKLTFDPPWDQSRMSDEARLALNIF
jgi:FeS assembly SUF system protein